MREEHDMIQISFAFEQIAPALIVPHLDLRRILVPEPDEVPVEPVRHTRRTNRTTEADKDLICNLRRRNWSIADIAERLGKSPGTITYWCMILGAEPRKPAPNRRRQLKAHTRNGHPVRPFTDDEDALLLSMVGEGLNYAEIGRRLDRRGHVCRKRVITVAWHNADGLSGERRTGTHG